MDAEDITFTVAQMFQKNWDWLQYPSLRA
jgi:hypothetical protein